MTRVLLQKLIRLGKGEDGAALIVTLALFMFMYVSCAGIFAIGHEFGGILSAFLFGMCMCVIYLKTDNILMTMSVHFINNLVAVILEAGGLDTYLFQMPMLPITLIVSIISGLLILIYIYKHIKLFTDW